MVLTSGLKCTGASPTRYSHFPSPPKVVLVLRFRTAVRSRRPSCGGRGTGGGGDTEWEMRWRWRSGSDTIVSLRSCALAGRGTHPGAHRSSGRTPQRARTRFRKWCARTSCSRTRRRCSCPPGATFLSPARNARLSWPGPAARSANAVSGCLPAHPASREFFFRILRGPREEEEFMESCAMTTHG